MGEVLVCHHALGPTAGLLSGGDEWGLPPNEDLEAARALADSVERAELLLYPGDRHLFADESGPDHDEGAATLAMERVLAFLERVG